MGTSEQWKGAQEDWAEACQLFQISVFHLADVAHQIGQERADLCKRRLAHILSEHGLLAIYSTCEVPYVSEHDSGPNSPYLYCLGACFDHVARISRLEYAGSPVSVVVDEDVKPRTLVTGLFSVYQREAPALAHIEISSVRQHVGLQCADLIAGAFRRQQEIGGLLKSPANNLHSAGLRPRSVGSHLSAETARQVREALEQLNGGSRS